MSTKPKDELEPASARTLGAAVRKTLKTLGLHWKVKSETTSFAGFGFGSMPFARVETDRLLTDEESKALAECLRELRAKPFHEGGGKAIIQLAGRDYAMGGAIHHYHHQ
jgi:hypothetical protein